MPVSVWVLLSNVCDLQTAVITPSTTLSQSSVIKRQLAIVCHHCWHTQNTQWL